MAQTEELVTAITSLWPDLALERLGAYECLPVCVIDAVFSIGVRYESTERTVNNFREWADWRTSGDHRITEFIDKLAGFCGDWERMALEAFQNRQRTSTRSGILKAEAVFRFATELQRARIEVLADAAKIDTERLSEAIARIPGQSSLISFKYFLMLAGHQGLVKPDRMVIRFVETTLKRKSTAVEAERLLLSALQALQPKVPGITAVGLDNKIWRYQRGLRAIKPRSQKLKVQLA